MAIRKKLILALFSTALTVGWAVTSADTSWAQDANGGRGGDGGRGGAEAGVLRTGGISQREPSQGQAHAVPSSNYLDPGPAVQPHRGNLGHDDACSPGGRGARWCGHHGQTSPVRQLQFGLGGTGDGHADPDRLPSLEDDSRTRGKGGRVDDRGPGGWQSHRLRGKADAVLRPHCVGSLRHFQFVRNDGVWRSWRGNREECDEASVRLHLDGSTVDAKRGATAGN